MIETSHKICRYSVEVMPLLTCSNSETAIFHRHVVADDKYAFVAALIGIIMLNHRRLQASGGSQKSVIMEETSEKIRRYSDGVLMNVRLNSNPESLIFRQYVKANDQDAFVAGLIRIAILKYRQWQGRCGSLEQYKSPPERGKEIKMPSIDYLESLKSMLVGWGMPEEEAKMQSLMLAFPSWQPGVSFPGFPAAPQSVPGAFPCTEEEDACSR
ncbi:MAG: hypothetical protein LBL79_05990 [Prevotella sp.]|jgi:hypothetical protein|nr:hypothetical protein [Prevotella sp.]